MKVFGMLIILFLMILFLLGCLRGFPVMVQNLTDKKITIYRNGISMDSVLAKETKKVENLVTDAAGWNAPILIEAKVDNESIFSIEITLNELEKREWKLIIPNREESKIQD